MIAAAVVTKDVPPYALFAGVPARRIGFVCACGETLPQSLRCVCHRRYRGAGAGLVAVAARGPTSR
jgi:UDP-2-acetamido-3-amino-2,3-dideoxy-glucuronate N-acetyltransferase